MTLKLTALDNNVFVKETKDPIVQAGRSIYRFIFENPRSTERAKTAADAITSFMRDNPDLLFISKPTPPETLEDRVITLPYLVINKNIVCLSNQSGALADLNIKCKDYLFSGSVLTEPVFCTLSKHVFEKKHIQEWIRLKGNLCPGGNHKVHEGGSQIEIDAVSIEEIRGILTEHERIRKVEESNTALTLRAHALQATIRPDRTAEFICGDAFKLIAKSLEFAIKPAGTLSTTIVKAIPVVSVIFALFFMGRRIMNGIYTGDKFEYIKAAVEIGSGVAACFPGIGTGVAIGLDAALLVHDSVTYSNNGTPQINVNVSNAYQILGLDPAQRPHLKRADVDKAYKELAKVVHPDHGQDLGQYGIDELTKLQQMLTNARDVLHAECKS